MWLIPTTHPTTVPHSSRITVVTKPLGSHSHRRNNQSSENFSYVIFRQPLLQRMDTPPSSPEPELLIDEKISNNRSLTRPPGASIVPHAHGSFFDRRTSPPESPAADLQAYVPGFLIQHLHHPLCPFFSPTSYTFRFFLFFIKVRYH